MKQKIVSIINSTEEKVIAFESSLAVGIKKKCSFLLNRKVDYCWLVISIMILGN